MLFSSALLSFALIGSASVLASTPPNPQHNNLLDNGVFELPAAAQPFASHPKSKSRGALLTMSISERILRGDWLRMPCPADLVCNFPNCACRQESHILCIVLTYCQMWMFMCSISRTCSIDSNLESFFLSERLGENLFGATDLLWRPKNS